MRTGRFWNCGYSLPRSSSARSSAPALGGGSQGLRQETRSNEYPQFQNRPFLTGRYLHGGPLPGASPLPVRYYELSICQVDPKAETITLLLDPFGAVEARLTIPLREEKAHG